MHNESVLGTKLKKPETELRDLPLEQIISLIELFPACHLPTEVLFDNPNEKTIIKTYRYFYKGLTVWLSHLAARKRLAPEAIFTNWKYYQPHAQIYAAYLELVTGVFHRSILEGHFDSPAHAWAALIYIQCKQVLSNSGLFGVPVIHGKVEITNHNLVRLKQFDQRELTLIPPANHEASKTTICWHEAPEDYLTALASDIAERDPDFDTNYWVPYRRSFSRWERSIRDCKKIQAAYLLPNRELFVTGKRQKIPKQFKDIKGFECNSQ